MQIKMRYFSIFRLITKKHISREERTLGNLLLEKVWDVGIFMNNIENAKCSSLLERQLALCFLNKLNI